MSKGIKGRGHTHSPSRKWEKAMKKASKAKHRSKNKNKNGAFFNDKYF